MYSANNPPPVPTPAGQGIPGMARPPAQPGGLTLQRPQQVPHTLLIQPGQPVHLPGPRLVAAPNRVSFPATPQV